MKTPTDIIKIPLEQLTEDRSNYRRSMDATRLQELKASIREHGVMQNLEVQEMEGGIKAVIIGNRRLRATTELVPELRSEIEGATKAGNSELVADLTLKLERLLELNCRVLSGDAAKHAKERQLVENLQREDISPVDEAYGYEDLRKTHGFSIEEIAKRVGKDKTPKYNSNRLKLLRVPAKLLDPLRDKVTNITIRTCESVGKIPSKKDREAIVERILNPKYEDEPLRQADVIKLIREEYVIPIREGGFDPADAQLLPLKMEGGVRVCGGSCEDCPFRSGNDPDLEDELATGNEGKRGKKAGVDPQLCTNVGGCFQLKVDAAWEKMKTSAKSEGNEALTLEESKKVFSGYSGDLAYNAPYVDFKEKPGHTETGHYDDEKVARWEKLLEDTGAKITYARNPVTKKIHKLVKRDIAIEAVNLKAKQTGKPSPFAKASKGRSPAKSEAEKKKAAAEREKSQLTWNATYLMLTRVREAIVKMGMTVERARAIAEIAIQNAGCDGQFVLCKWLNLEPVKSVSTFERTSKPLKAYVATLTDVNDLLALAHIANTQRYGKHHTEGTREFKQLAKAFEVDRKSAEAEAKRQLDEKKAAKAKKTADTKSPMKSRSAAVRRNQEAVAADEQAAASKLAQDIHEKTPDGPFKKSVPALEREIEHRLKKGDTIEKLLEHKKEIDKKKAAKKATKKAAKTSAKKKGAK